MQEGRTSETNYKKQTPRSKKIVKSVIFARMKNFRDTLSKTNPKIKYETQRSEKTVNR